MFHLILVEPEIPPNTGNIIRLCANTGATLHLVKPLGFTLAAKQLRRAGLDYHDLARVHVHENLDLCLSMLAGSRLFVIETSGTQTYDEVRFERGDALIFGPETRGVGARLCAVVPAPRWLRIPMVGTSRSLNLSNSVALVLYEAWRQLGFEGAGR